MWRKSLATEDKSKFLWADAAIEAITAMGSDFIFYGPMTGTSRVFFAVAAATSLLTTLAYTEGVPLPGSSHPLNLLFPEAVEQLQKEDGKGYGKRT